MLAGLFSTGNLSPAGQRGTAGEGLASEFEDNPDHISDQDDLHEIQAGDDLNEPNTEDYQPDDEGAETDSSADDADGNDGAADEPANPAELNS